MISTHKMDPCPNMTEISNDDGHFTIVHCNSWERSAQLCQAIGKQLAVPKDLAENEKFYNVAKGLGSFQLGIREKEQEGWVDEHGQSLTFENWAPENPKSKFPPNQGVVVVGFKGNGAWENKHITAAFNALCV